MLAKGKIDKGLIHINRKVMMFSSFLVFLHERLLASLTVLCKATLPGEQKRRFTYNFQIPMQGIYVVQKGSKRQSLIAFDIRRKIY